MKPYKKYLFRVLSYVLGLFFLAVGVAVSVNSNLGVSPVNSLPYAISSVSGVGLGACVTLVYCFYILVQVVLLRREFHPKNLLQIVFSTLFGYFVDFAKFLVGDFAIPTYPGRLLMLAVSIVLVSVGLVLYLSADIVPMPMEGMTKAITTRLGRFPFHNVKVAVDCASVGLAAVISLVGLHRLESVREGTIIAAVVTGKVMAVISRRLRPRIEALWAEAEMEPKAEKSAGRETA